MKTVHARHSYLLDEIRWGEKFDDILSAGESGSTVIDYSRFNVSMPEK